MGAARVFGLDGFGITTMWSPWMIAGIGSLGVLYLYATGPGRRHFRDSGPVSTGRKAWFLGGLLSLYVAFGSPIDLLGHLMFTFHMLTMAFAYIIAPPMLLAGTPGWLIQPIGSMPGFRRLKFLLHPIVALLLFNLAFSMYHVPAVHDSIMLNYTVHTLYYLLLLIASILMWFPVICPVKSMDRLAGFKKMGFIFANSVLLMPACALIIFADEPMYSTYTDPSLWASALGYCVPLNSAAILERFSGPDSLAWMEPQADQQLGGVIMKLIQEAVYGSILFFVFLQWYRRENPKQIDVDLLEPAPHTK